jgi:hypothetical protein
MTTVTLQQALENIYTSLNSDNDDIDLHIRQLKVSLGDQNVINIDPTRLVHNNRQGRKMMQSYFKKRGVIVEFTDKPEA